jgi:hypothetical protein
LEDVAGERGEMQAAKQSKVQWMRERAGGLTLAQGLLNPQHSTAAAQGRERKKYQV